jgi:GTP cyclohydrolase I
MAIMHPDSQSTTLKIEHAVTVLLESLGEDPKREGLIETPHRVAKSYDKLFGGYKQDWREVLSPVFKTDKYDEMIMLKNIEMFSTCEHHMLPFFGRCSVAYIPGESGIIGISKLARLVEVFSRRLQIQERLTTQIADALQQFLQPVGVMVVIEAQHLCMVARGVEKQNSILVTSAIKGAFEKPEVRKEFFDLKGQ